VALVELDSYNFPQSLRDILLSALTVLGAVLGVRRGASNR